MKVKKAVSGGGPAVPPTGTLRNIPGLDRVRGVVT